MVEGVVNFGSDNVWCLARISLHGDLELNTVGALGEKTAMIRPVCYFGVEHIACSN